MFKCEQCPSVFPYKENLTVHQKMHAGVNFPCTICPTSFTKKSNLNLHIKNIHAVTRIKPVLQPGEIEIAPNIIVPDQVAGPSNQIQIIYNSNNIPNVHFDDDGYDEMCVEVLDRAENAGLCGPSNRIPNSNNISNEHFDDDGYDEMCVEVLDRAENAGLCGPPNRIPNSNNISNGHFDDDGYDEMCVKVLDRAENAGLCGPSNRIPNSNNISNGHFDDDGYDEMYAEVLDRLENLRLCDKRGEKRVHEDDIPPSPPMSFIMASKKLKTTSPQYIHEYDTKLTLTQSWGIAPRHLFSPFFFDGECSQINLTPATLVPVNKTSNNENDGPLHFNQLPRQEK
ncbi:PR domain zinc finger protein 16-like [Aphis craccivora]|uniref:PR domain zinc finger protein 16-like n=1 Tax=Aphis craccivora TaxID=307492 RepID=A0A6G0VTY7_APHCR|nr:PR domain zinc finger protein 16-like [Aphis craccivora]